MPFTFAHPVAILPLRKKFAFLSFPALVIGSVIPDFGYYFPISNYFIQSAHSFMRIISFGLPVGTTVFFIYFILRKTFIFIAPDPHRSAMKSVLCEAKITPKFIFRVVLSIFIGASTHVIWDSFTHKTGWSVLHLNFLTYSLLEIQSSQYSVYNFLQHLSTLVGSGYLLLKYKNWLGTRFPCEPLFSWRHCVWLLLVAIAALSCFKVTNLASLETFWEIRKFSFQIAVQFIQTFFFLLFVLLVALKEITRTRVFGKKTSY